MSVPPPPQWSYQPAPAKGMPGWAWGLIGAGVTAVVMLIGGFVLFLSVGFSGVGGFDGIDGYYVSDGDVTDAIAEPCSELEDAVADLRPFTSDGSGRESLVAVADASRAVGDAVRDASGGSDVRAFADDWTEIADAVDRYAESLDDPDARFELPRVDGTFVSDRIYFGNDDCYVPVRLETLDPEAADELYGSGW